jgi:ATP-dependent Clp protease ATP-binding subunit ClpA
VNLEDINQHHIANGYPYQQAPFTGRITRIIPFFPFSPREQLIVADKYLRELKEDLASDISLSELSPYLVRHMCLSFEHSQDLEVCQVVVEGEYDRTLGARSIANAIERKVKKEIVTEWFLNDEAVEETDNEKPMQKCVLAVRSLEEGKKTVVVLLKDDV